MKEFSVIVFIIISGSIVNLFSGDIGLYGDINMSGTYHNKPEGEKENSVTAEIDVTGNHNFKFKVGKFFAHHNLMLNQKGEFDYKLYEAYLSIYPSDYLNLTFGRQRINWGSGYLFNPTDALHPRSMDGSKEMGFTGISFMAATGSNFYIDLCIDIYDCFGADKIMNGLKYALYTSLTAGKIDMAASFVYQYDRHLRPGFSISADVFNFILNLETALEFINNAAYPESSTTLSHKSDFYPHLILDAGIERTFSSDVLSFTMVFEYLYNMTGYKKNEFRGFYNGAAFLIPEDEYPEYFGRHYFACSFTFDFTELLITEHSILWNTQDRSLGGNHSLTYIGFSGFDLKTGFSWNAGKRNKSEFGSIPDRFLVEAGAVVHF